MSHIQYCQERTKASGSSFYYAFRFLSENQRRAMYALYAFCREVDDIADEITDPIEAKQQIEQWGIEISNVFQAQPSHPVGHELYWAKQYFAWDEELFHEMLDGMLTDISAQAFVKESDLNLYCYRVASVVGLLTIEVFGYKQRQSRSFANHLGKALQLTNILRDIPEDMQRNRIYIPQQQRAQFKVSDDDMAQAHMCPALQNLLEHYGQQAEESYQLALQQLPISDRISLRPAIIMAAIYYAQLRRMKTFHWDVWKNSGRISSIRKLWIAWRVWYYEKKFEKTKNSSKYPLRLTF
ncbi:MAG: presqualene diphosphate synthase HpnD [Mariprofundaceae bacterium]